MKAMTRRTSALFVLALLPAGHSLFAADETAVPTRGEAVAVCIEKGPTLDGTMQDPLWQKCPPWPMGACTSESGQKYKTWAKVLFDSTHVYVGVYCEEPDTAGMVVRASKPDDTVWNDDSIEVFLRPDPQEPNSQFVVNPRGTLYDARDRNPSFDSTAEVQTHVEQGKAWTVTLKIPMKKIIAYVGQDQTWRMNVYRSRSARGGDPALQYAWSIMSNADYHAVGEFGFVSGVNVPRRTDGVTRIRAAPVPRRMVLNKGTEVGGVTVYHKMSFDAGPGGWKATDGGQVGLGDDAVSGQALHVACEKSWAGARLRTAVSGSRDLKMALLMKGRNLRRAGVIVHDATAGDHTTPYGYRDFQDGGWTPILYRLDRFRYHSATAGYVGEATLYDAVRFYGPPDAKPGMSFTLDDFVIYRGTDRQPPEKVTALEAEATAAGVQLSWEPAADNVGVQVYVIARAGAGGAFSKIAESHTSTYLDAAVGKGPCRYRVFAVDFEENLGQWSDPVSVNSTSAPARPSLSPEEQDRPGYADRVWAVHARGAGRVRRGHVVLFGDSLTGATVYPHCVEAALGTLSVDAFGYPSMQTAFGRQRVREILQKENPEFMFVLFGTDNSKAEEDLPPAMEDLAAIVKVCDEHGTVAVLGTIPPRGWTPESLPEAGFNARVVKLCRKLQVPTGYVFEGFQAAGDRRKYLGDDGVHWRGEGMQLTARAWGKTLDQIRFVLRDRK